MLVFVLRRDCVPSVVSVAEAINTEGIMSAYEWCIAQGILRVHQVGNTRMLQLTPDYQQPPGQTHDNQFNQQKISRERLPHTRTHISSARDGSFLACSRCECRR